MRWPWQKEERGFKSIENPGVPISASNILAYLGWETSGVTVNEQSALKIPAMWAGVNFISSTIATLPLNLFRKVDGERQKQETDPLNRILHSRPNEEWTSYRWRKYTMTRILTGGRGYTYIERANNGKVKALWPLNPNQTKPVMRGMRMFYEYTPATGGQVITYQAHEIIDIPWLLEADQVSHVSPCQRLAESLGLALSLQGYASRYFENGGVPPLSLEGPFNSPGAVERASADITTAIKNASAQGRPVLPMPTGHQLKQIGYNPEQGQLTDARRFTLEEVARILGLPPVFLQDLTHGTYSNTEQQDLNVAKHLISQWVTCLEQEMNLKLFRQSDQFVKFNLNALMRGDFKTRMDGMSKAVQNSLMTPNEGRATEDLPSLDGGDELMIQQNMTGLTGLARVNDGD